MGPMTPGQSPSLPPAHSPSLTVLVPVYGETMVRSWPDMFREQPVGGGLIAKQMTSLTNFEYMVERQLLEFQCQVLEPSQVVATN